MRIVPLYFLLCFFGEALLDRVSLYIPLACWWLASRMLVSVSPLSQRPFLGPLKSTNSVSLSTNVRSPERPAQISVAGRVLKADDDLVVLGLSVVTGGPLEYERRIAKA